MTCLDMIFADIDTLIDCEIDCVGCVRTDCPDDRRVDDSNSNRRGSGTNA